MVTKLSEPPEESIRQFLTDNLRPAEVEGYDPTQTDPDASDFLPVSSDWSRWGDHYPVIIVQETDGPTIPNSGNTNYNGIQGDGSGPNQYTIYNITVSCQAVQGADVSGLYRNSTDARTLVKELYSECHHQIQTNATSAVSEALFVGMTPPTITRSTEETDAGSTLTWVQAQGGVNMGVINEP